MIIALAILIGIPCQHRLVEEGESSLRLFSAARFAANTALVPMAAGIGCAVAVATASQFGTHFAVACAASSVGVAAFGWYGLAYFLRHRVVADRSSSMDQSKTPLHAKIEQMLTEARVILPGTQALLGFQMVVMLSSAFGKLPVTSQYIHVTALLINVVSVVLLICPAAVHRIAFGGRDEAHFLTVGSRLVTLALGPLAVAISLDFYVALGRIFATFDVAAAGAVIAFVLMTALWYLLPLFIRWRLRPGS
jgi:hypothetical protein